MSKTSLRMTKHLWPLWVICCLLFVCLSGGTAFAADADILGRISNTFYTEAEGWASTLQNAAFTLFKYFIILDICLFGIRGALDLKTGAPVASIAGEFANFILFAAFMYVCIKYYKEWSGQVIQGFTNLANIAGGEKVDVSDIFRTGLEIAKNLWKSMELTSPIKSLGLLVAGIIMLFCFALMAAEILLVKCEAFIVMNAGIVLLGFGGMRYFKEYSVNFMKYGFTVAVKLFVLQLMMGIILSFSEGFETAGTELADIAVIMGAAVVMLTLTRNIPSIISSLIMGAHGAGGRSYLGIGGMALAGAMGGAVGAVVNAGRTVKYGAQEAAASGATGAGLAARAAKNIAGSYGASAVESLTGAPKGGSFGHRAMERAKAAMKDPNNVPDG
jgi:type IV secretion system protein TrbL